MKFLLLFVFAFATMHLQSQYADKKIYYWDENFKPTSDQRLAKFFTAVNKIADTCWQWDTYNMLGPLVSSKRFKDRDGKVQHGNSSYYRSNGYVDSSGKFLNGFAEGDWYYYNGSGQPMFKKTFAQGKIDSWKDLTAEQTEKKIQTENKVQTTADTAKTRDEKEAVFSDVLGGWQRYLLQNLTYPKRALKSKITGEVVVRFAINTTGKPEEISIFHSVEISLDREAERMIRESPNWIPAYKEGKVVKSYVRQPFTFRLQ